METENNEMFYSVKIKLNLFNCSTVANFDCLCSGSNVSNFGLLCKK